MSPEQAELIQKGLNLKEEDVPEEKRELFNFLKPSMDAFLLSSIELDINI